MDILNRIQSDFTPKDPIQYDDVELKKQVCSHIEYALHEDGNYYCKACKACDSDSYWGINRDRELTV